MPFIISKTFLKDILSKQHIATQMLYFHLLRTFIPKVYIAFKVKFYKGVRSFTTLLSDFDLRWIKEQTIQFCIT